MADSDPIITEAEYRTWLPPQEALRRVGDYMDDWIIAAQAIVRRVNAGLIRVHAKSGTVQRSAGNEALKPFAAVPEVVRKFWDSTGNAFALPFWTSGDAEVQLRVRKAGSYDRTEIWTLFGVRFDPVALAELMPTSPPLPVAGLMPPPPEAFDPLADGLQRNADFVRAAASQSGAAIPAAGAERLAQAIFDASRSTGPLADEKRQTLPPAAKHPGGKPPKQIWEAVWVNIAARLINGDFDPKRQKDVEDAIKDEAQRLGDDVGDATARKHAKYLWDKVKKVHN